MIVESHLKDRACSSFNVPRMREAFYGIFYVVNVRAVVKDDVDVTSKLDAPCSSSCQLLSN